MTRKIIARATLERIRQIGAPAGIRIVTGAQRIQAGAPMARADGLTATRADIVHHRNERLDLLFQVVDRNGGAVDIAGQQFEFAVSANRGDDPPDHAFAPAIVSAPDGTLRLTVPPDAISAGMHHYDLVSIAGGIRTLRWYGMLEARDGVTQPIGMLSGYRFGLRADFAKMIARVIDGARPANDFYGDPNDLFTAFAPSPKFIRTRSGRLEDGSTLRCEFDDDGPLGIHVERESTNLLRHSQAFDRAPWTASGIVVNADAATAPDGSRTAARLASASSDYISLRQPVTVTAGVRHTQSWYVRPDRADRVSLRLGSPAFASRIGVTFDFETETFGPISRAGAEVSDAAAAAERLPGGWRRLSVSGIVSAGDTTLRNDIIMPASSSMYLWGAQFEVGDVTSLIPTAAAQATRLADNLMVPLDRLPYGPGYEPGGIANGTFGIEVRHNVTPRRAVNSYLRLGSAGASDRIRLWQWNGGEGARYAVTADGAEQAALAEPRSGRIGSFSRIYARWAPDNFALSADGHRVRTDSSGAVPDIAAGELRIDPQGGDYHIRLIDMIPRAVNNAALEAAST